MLGSARTPVGLLLALTACAGVSPRPEAVTPDSLPVREVAAADRERLVEQCVRAAVTRHYSEAERAAVEALGIDPRNARARAVRGTVLLQAAREKDPPDLFLANEGEAEVVLAERLAPEDPFVAWLHALFLAETGHLSAAAAAAEAGLERTRRSSGEERAPLFGLAGTYRYELGEERAALPLLQAYVEARPDDAAASFRIGSCLLRMSMVPTGPAENADEIAQRQAEQAARAFQRCANLAPGDEDAALAVGAATMRAAMLAAKRGDDTGHTRLLTASREQFGAVAERFPASAEALFRLGVVEEEAGRGEQAIAAYEAALARDGMHLASLLNLASMLDGDDRTEADAARVVELLRRALQVDLQHGGLEDREQRLLEQRLRGS